MPRLNQVFLMGNLTRDPKLTFTPKGTAVCECGIAVNESWTGENGEKKESVCFVDFQLWSTAAETFAQHMAKGSTVMLQGRLKFEQWQKDGENRSKLIVTVESFQFLDRKPEGK